MSLSTGQHTCSIISYLLVQINCKFLEDGTMFYVLFVFFTVPVDSLIDYRVGAIFIVELIAGI